MAKLKCVERDFIFNLAVDAEAGSVDQCYYLDIGQVHSLCNRISAKQGMVYGVESIEIGVATGGQYIASLWRLPLAWSLVNAWEKAMRMWYRQREEIAEQAGVESTRARYDDFKLFMSRGQENFSDNLIPVGYRIDGNPSDYVYDWVPSRVTVPNDQDVVGDTKSYYMHLIGDDFATPFDSKGLIKAYAASRSRPQPIDPNVVDNADGGLFVEMFDTGMDDDVTIQRYQTSGDSPPYLLGHDDHAYYPGGQYQGSWATVGGIMGPGSVNTDSGPLGHQLVDILSVNANHNFNSDSTGSFMCPLGLLAIKVVATGINPSSGGPVISPGFTNASLWMRLRLSAGGYKGVAAIAMQDVN